MSSAMFDKSVGMTLPDFCHHLRLIAGILKGVVLQGLARGRAAGCLCQTLQSAHIPHPPVMPGDGQAMALKGGAYNHHVKVASLAPDIQVLAASGYLAGVDVIQGISRRRARFNNQFGARLCILT